MWVSILMLGPQLNVTFPPPFSAASNAGSLQLLAVPSPTTSAGTIPGAVRTATNADLQRVRG
jgi:hypothetical protein